jgi:hypothetical protein
MTEMFMAYVGAGAVCAACWFLVVGQGNMMDGDPPRVVALCCVACFVFWPVVLVLVLSACAFGVVQWVKGGA